MATKPVPTQWAAGSKLNAPQLNAGDYDVWNFIDRLKPLCVITQTVAQTGIAATTFVPVLFDSEIIDTDNQHSTTSNTSRVVIGNTLGWYRCSGAIAYATTGGARKGVELLQNGGSAITGSQHFFPPGTSFHSVELPVTFVQATLSTDYVELAAWSDVAATSLAVSGAFRSMFAVEYVGTLQ